MDLDVRSIDAIISSLHKESAKTKERFLATDKPAFTIDNFYDMMYDLFKSNNLLIEDQQDLDGNTPNKFVLTEEYPEQTNANGNIVTFEITRREPASMGQGMEPFQGTTRYRPMFLGEERDVANNDIKLNFTNLYDNLITLICWSTHGKSAREVASTLESLFTAMYYFIRQHVPVFLVLGRQQPIFTDRYGDKKMIGIPIKIFVKTSEISTIKVEELEKMPSILLSGVTLKAQISTGN